MILITHPMMILIYVLLTEFQIHIESVPSPESRNSRGGFLGFIRSRSERSAKDRHDFPLLTYIFYRKCKSSVRLDGKVAIITGGNSGIGKKTALEFYRRGARVIIACRDMEKCNKATAEIRQETDQHYNHGVIEARLLDLASFRSVHDFAEDILATEKHIHLLINNAGVMMCPWELTEDGHERQFATNHLGHFLLTMLLLPRIITSQPARIVNVSSLAHVWSNGNMYYEDITMKKNYTPEKAYARSKLANILFTRELSRRLQANGIKGVTTYSLHPGVVDTPLWRHLDTALPPFINWILNTRLVKWLVKTPAQGAQTTIHCAIDENARNETGLHYSNCRKNTPSKQARDAKAAEKLWKFSWKAVKLNEKYDPFYLS